MSYYNYVTRYSPSFLRKYQTDTYSHLMRSTNYHDIVHMNATSTLSIDEDATFRFKAPYNLSSLFGFFACVYWYFYHVDMFQANTIRHRLRSYHNYKMWSRLEILVKKHSVEACAENREMMEQVWLKSHNITREQLNALLDGAKQGKSPDEVMEELKIQFDPEHNIMVKI